MILNSMLRILWSVISPILAKIPSVQLNYDGAANSSVFQYIRASLYFLPMQTVLKILGIIIALWIFRIVIAFLHSLWASLPLV